MALRVLPALADAMVDREGRRENSSATVALPVLRALAVAWLAGIYPNEGARLQRAAAFASRDSFYAAFHAKFAASAAADAAGGAADAAVASSSTAASFGTSLAAAANAAVSFTAEVDVAASAAASRASSCGAVAADAATLERGVAPRVLGFRPLWQEGQIPPWTADGWSRLKSALVDEDKHWEVWTDWYQDRLDGKAPEFEEVELARGMLGEEFWEGGPERVNRELLRILAEERAKLREGRAEWDFFVSYSGADEPQAREVVEVAEGAGYTTFAQFKDFTAGSNFVAEMQRGLANSGRVIALYSPEYQASAHCQAEWNAAYNSDPAGNIRTILPFLLRPTELSSLAKQIVYVSLVGLREEARRERILQAMRYSPPVRTKSEIKQALAEVASPDVSVSDGRLDAGPNTTFDRSFVDNDLSTLPALQRAVAQTLLESLPHNCPRIVRFSLKTYEAELRDRGAQPVVGVLQQMVGALEAEYGSQEAELWGAGLANLFGSFFANNQLLLTHFPLKEDRERLFSETPVDEDAATGSTLTKPTAEVTQAVDAVVDIDKATVEFQKVNEAISQMAKDIGSLPPPPQDQQQPSSVVTPKRRYVLTTLGFYERVYAFLGSTASIASTPQGIALAEKLKAAIEALLRLIP
jgi:hypothetical protein